MVIAGNEATGAIPQIDATNTGIAPLALAMTRCCVVSQSELKCFWVSSSYFAEPRRSAALSSVARIRLVRCLVPLSGFLNIIFRKNAALVA